MVDLFCFFYIVKQHYYVLARIHHPDKTTAKTDDKFALINRIYLILSDEEKRKKYDHFNLVDADSGEVIKLQWHQYIKPITDVDMEYARQKYIGSEEEEKDVMANWNGSMVNLLNSIPFMRREDEERMIELVKKLMKENKIAKKPIRKIAQ